VGDSVICCQGRWAYTIGDVGQVHGGKPGGTLGAGSGTGMGAAWS
jgi:hypothetical protein